MRGDAGEEDASALVLEQGGGEQLRGHERGRAEDGHVQRVTGEAEEGLGEVLDQLRPVANGGTEERLPGAAIVRSELGYGGFECVLEGDGGAIVEWMRDGAGWLDPAQSMSGEGQAAEERRCDAEGVTGGAEVVVEAGEGDFGGGAGATEGGAALVDGDRDAALREGDGGGETVGAGADDVGGLERHVNCDATANKCVGEEGGGLRGPWLDWLLCQFEREFGGDAVEVGLEFAGAVRAACTSGRTFSGPTCLRKSECAMMWRG